MNRLKRIFLKHQLACFIAICVFISVIMSLVSLWLYKQSGAFRLDMSRPGYEKVRKQVERGRNDQPYESSGVLDAKAIKDFERRLDKYSKNLDNLGNFDQETLSDHNLGLDNPAKEEPNSHGDAAGTLD